MLAVERSLDEIAAIVFVDMAVIIVAARLMGALFRRMRQPAVVGEIIAGLLLGPSLLGQLPGDLDLLLFPLDVRPFLKVIAQLGLVIFMFMVGLELDLKLIRGKERAAGVISVVSVALPFGLGVALAAVLYSTYSGADAKFLPFACFVGASMSVTAFPVLARILTERGMYRTEVGALTLACAAIDDILAWSLLAFVLATIEASGGAGDLPRILLFSLLYVAVMFLVVKPVLARVGAAYHRAGQLTPNIMAVILVGLLVSSWITATIGIHQIFGAFLFGVVMPREQTAELFHEILERLESVSVLLLLPVFFVVAGLDADVTNIGLDGLGALALILLVAISGKFLGATGAARAQGFPLRKSAAVGILMNTRGLTELVILSVGLSTRVIDEQLYTLLVVMAIVTTVMTEPLLRLVYPDRLLERDVAEAERTRVGAAAAWRVLVLLDDVHDDPLRAERMVAFGADLVARTPASELVLTRFLASTRRLEVGSGLGSELGEMAASMAELHDLTRSVERRGITCSVLSQFSDDPAAALIAQAGAIGADVVVVPWSLDAETPTGFSGTVRALLDNRTVEAAVLALPPQALGPEAGRPVLVMLGDEERDAAAVELSVRVAGSRGVPVVLDGGEGRRAARRLNALAQDVARLGVECSVASESGDRRVEAREAGLVVMTLEGAAREPNGTVVDVIAVAAAPVLLVRPEETLSPESASTRLARLDLARAETAAPSEES